MTALHPDCLLATPRCAHPLSKSLPLAASACLLAEFEPGLASKGGEEATDDELADDEMADDELADDLLLPLPAQLPRQSQQQSGRSSPAASGGAAPGVHPGQQQRAPQEHRAAANAAFIGPEEELVVRVDVDGNDWPQDDPGERFRVHSCCLMAGQGRSARGQP